MRHPFILASILIGLAAPAAAQVSIGIGIGLPGLSIGVNVPVFPDLVRVPGYPVYYAPRLQSNFFFYDGMYWVYESDQWYASSWYNGPWALVAPEVVPVYVLRVPVRYYRSPPPYFSGWRVDAPPRWGDHWGPSWQQHRSGWDRWDRRAAPAPAPLPAYQRQYPASRYPAVEQQPALRGQNYRYRPREPVVRQHFDEHAPSRVAAPAPRAQPAPAPQQRPTAPPRTGPGRQLQDSVPTPPMARIPPVQEDRRSPQQPQQPAARPARDPRADKAAPQESPRGRGRAKDREDGDERGPGRKD